MMRFQAAFGVVGGKAVGEFQLMLWRGDGSLPDGWYKIFQAETFAKPVTDGASAARRHFEKSVMLCLISNLATSCRRSILGFRLLLGVLQRFQAAILAWR